MKVLFVTYDFPYPPNSGGKNRAYNMMKYAVGPDVEIHLLSFVREGFDIENLKEVEKIGVSSVEFRKRRRVKSINTFGKNLISKESIFKTLYFDKSFYKLIKKIIQEKKIDLVHFESSYTGYFIGEELRKMGVKQVLGTENIEYLLYEDYKERSKNIFKKPILTYQTNRLKREEEEMMKNADLCIAVTEGEASYIKSVTGKECEIIENAVDLNLLEFKFNRKIAKNILFVGNFLYMPNVEAIQFFLKKIMPSLDKDITLTVVGKNAHEVIDKNSQIIIKEFVDDIREEYWSADALVFPLKIGGGTNFKVLEAMALGTPVVAFSDRLKSLRAKENEEFIAVNDAREFVEEINRITNDKIVGEQIAKNARRLIEKYYSWEKIGLKLGSVWKKLYEKN